MLLSACGGGGDGDSSSGGGIETINVTGSWTGTVHSDSSNLNGTLNSTLQQTGNQVSGTASIIFPDPYVSCLESSTVSGTVAGNSINLTIKAQNGTTVVADGQGTSTQLAGTYRTTITNATLGCQPDMGSFDVRKQ